MFDRYFCICVHFTEAKTQTASCLTKQNDVGIWMTCWLTSDASLAAVLDHLFSFSVNMEPVDCQFLQIVPLTFWISSQISLALSWPLDGRVELTFPPLSRTILGGIKVFHTSSFLLFIFQPSSGHHHERI